MKEKKIKEPKVKKEKKKKRVKLQTKKSGWRNFLFMLAKALVFLPRLIFFPTKIIHKERLPKGKRYLAVTNHQSWIDVIYCLFSLPGRRYIIAKKELEKNGFLRGVRKWCGLIFIDREKPSVDSVREILAVLKRDEPIIMFPEGTRNKESRELLPIKSGAGSFAVRTDAPIIPVMIYKRARVCRRNYIYVGESLDLSEYRDVRLTPEITAEIDFKVREHMLKTMAEMDDYVENKRWKKKNRLPLEPPSSEPVNVDTDEPIKDNTARDEGTELL